jgi:hypothetical protein
MSLLGSRGSDGGAAGCRPCRGEGSQASSPVSPRAGNFHQTLMDIPRAAPLFPDGRLDWGVCRRDGRTGGSGRSVVPVWGRVNHSCDRMRPPTALGYENVRKMLLIQERTPQGLSRPFPRQLRGGVTSQRVLR